ncbi:MAG TPA: hypothetical protein VNY52_01995 [Solirubrobacteraceae bacterium]|nr:hypothetical protein [Solirubrobacteraceae bacterium]
MPASAEACSTNTEQVRVQEINALRLPDCRAYEQVSPPDKNATDALGRAGAVESSPLGDSVTYFSLAPFPGVAGSSEDPTYIGARGRGEWLSQGLLPPTNPGVTTEVVGLTEDLSVAIIEDYPSSPALTPDSKSGQRNYYLRDSADGSYRLLAVGPAVVEFQAEKLHYAGATLDDGGILFEEQAQLAANGEIEASTPGVPHLYEWDRGTVSQVGVLQNGEPPAGGAVAGPGGPAIEGEGRGEPGGAAKGFYTQDAISGDGSRIFFTGVETGQLYVRERGTATVQVSASQRTPPEAGEKPAFWRASTPDGRYVFFTSEAKLTNESTAEPGRPDLYRFDVDAGALSDLTTSAAAGADVLGTLGVSASGAYAYYTAGGVLTGANSEGGSPIEGAANLYEWHEGTGTTFIAALNPGADRADWSSFATGGETGPEGEKGSQVIPAGTTVMFTSVEPLNAAFDNAGHIEIYLYDGALSKERVKCVSCGGGGGVARANAYLVSSPAVASPGGRGLLTRNLADSGKRVFFETGEPLVPQDTNGQLDVYEWESEGEGSCSGARDGCRYLISTGQDSNPSYFGDASADGSNLFFFTRQSLVGQDRDDNLDVYDARIEGGIAAQSPARPPGPCTSSDECHGLPPTAPVLGVPVSAVFPAEGSIAPQSAKRANRPKAGRKRAHAKAKRKKRRGTKLGKKKRHGLTSIHRVRRGSSS